MPGKATGRAKRVADEALMFTTFGSDQDAKPAVVRGRRTKKVVNFDVPVSSARKLVRAQSAGLPTAKSSGLAEPLLDPADKLKVLWPLISNARTGEKAKEISKSKIPIFPNFLGLVLGCIEAKFCK